MLRRTLVSLLLLLSGLQYLSAQALKPVAFYLKNLPSERIGEWTDAQIKADLEAKGFIFIEVDCSSFPKTSPGFEDRLIEFHKNCPSVYSAYENSAQKVDIHTIMYVPEGYTVTKDIPVWNIREHGIAGTVESIMKFWNDNIAGKKKKKDGTYPEALPVNADGSFNVSDADLMYNPDGTPVDWWLRMDIIHPSGNAASQVPLLLNFATSGWRFAFSNPEAAEQTLWRNIIYLGFLTSGYAFANADHGYKPIARHNSWGHQEPYSMDSMNGLFTTTAYVRYIKAHLKEYNLNGKIGTTGISKAAYSAVRIADPDNAAKAAAFTYNGKTNTNPQPWEGFDSKVDVSYGAAGNGTKYFSSYVTPDNVPMILSAGKTDQYNKWIEFPSVVRYADQVDLIHLDFWMEELGHTYPCMGTDIATGERRYVLFKRFFDHYLKPDPATSADVFTITPKENSETVDSRGYSRILPDDDLLPDDMNGIRRALPITVRFLEPYSLDEISSKVKVTAGDGSEIQGTWTSSMRSTCFSFIPSKAMGLRREYTVTVPASLVSLSGNHPSAEAKRSFTISRRSEEDPGYTGEPTISCVANKAGNPVFLKVNAEYEDSIESVAWYIDDAPVQQGAIPELKAGRHKIKAVINAGAGFGTEVIVKYITVREA